MFGSALLCQRCANLSACILKIEVTDRISRRFIRGSALSVFFPREVAKNIVLIIVFCFVCTFFYLSFRTTSPCKNSIRYVGMNETIIKLFYQMKNDPRSYDRNFYNCVKKPEKNSGLQRGLKPLNRGFKPR